MLAGQALGTMALAMRLALPLAVLVVALAGCGDSKTYTRQEVVGAFRRHGYALAAVPKLDRNLLVPEGGPPFLVVVASDAEAHDAWNDYETQQTAQNFDARRANVLVISDEGLATSQRRRVLVTLASLRDRGEPVQVAGHSR